MIPGPGRDLEEYIADGVGRDQFIWRLFGEDQPDHRTVFFDLGSAESLIRIMDLESDGRASRDLARGARRIYVGVAARRVTHQQVVGAAPSRVLGAAVILDRLIWLHAHQESVAIDR